MSQLCRNPCRCCPLRDVDANGFPLVLTPGHVIYRNGNEKFSPSMISIYVASQRKSVAALTSLLTHLPIASARIECNMWEELVGDEKCLMHQRVSHVDFRSKAAEAGFIGSQYNISDSAWWWWWDSVFGRHVRHVGASSPVASGRKTMSRVDGYR